MTDPYIRALALDQSPTATGWAIGSPCEAKPIFGLKSLPSWHNREGERLHDFTTWLHQLMAQHNVTHVFYEAPVDLPFKDFDVTTMQGMQIGVIHLIAHTLNTPIKQITVGQMRERYLGTNKSPPGLKGEHSRNWFKQRAIQCCAARGLMVDNDNTAEALGHLDFGLASLSKRHASKTDIIFHRLDQQVATQRFRGEFQ